MLLLLFCNLEWGMETEVVVSNDDTENFRSVWGQIPQDVIDKYNNVSFESLDIHYYYYHSLTFRTRGDTSDNVYLDLHNCRYSICMLSVICTWMFPNSDVENAFTYINYIYCMFYVINPVTPCTSGSCHSNATCVQSGDGYTCVCPLGYRGAQCENKLYDYCCRRSLYIYHHYYMSYLLIHRELVYPRGQSQEYVVPPIPIHILPLLQGLLTC
jgi:hypothetical protein